MTLLLTNAQARVNVIKQSTIAYEFPTEKPKFEVVSGTGGKGGGGGGGGGGVGGIGVRRKRQTSTRIVDKKAPKPSDLGEVPSSITTEYQVQK